MTIDTQQLTFRSLCDSLSAVYGDADERSAVVRLLLDDAFGLSLTDLACGRLQELSDVDQQRLQAMMTRLERHEPVQYVTGWADFCGRRFRVTPSVLIPRPETDELCRMIVADHDRPFCGLQPPAPLRVLDIGTGSGCIAVTLSLDLPCTAVTAWDVSADALLVARDNGHRLHARVDWQLQDALAATDDGRRWDVIVSNPPYIADRERTAMRSNVLDYEPSLALFVPDDAPLRFYRAIARYAFATLTPGGSLYFEINPLFVDDLTAMMRAEGFTAVEVFNDFRGHQRMVKGGKP